MICKAMTNAGNPCSHFGEVTREGFCHIHDPQGVFRKQVELRREVNRKRRAYSDLERKKIFAAFGPFCYLCLRKIEVNAIWHIDHLIPFNVGGSDDFFNLRPVHHICNEFKSDEPMTAGLLLAIREIWEKKMRNA